jgi:vacuolar iron transporter family protein
VAVIVVGVAGATPSRGPIFTARLAGLVAGAVSMSLGEYISVSSQRASEHAQLAREEREIRRNPETELQELIGLYEAKELTRSTATTVAREPTEHDSDSPTESGICSARPSADPRFRANAQVPEKESRSSRRILDR